VPLHALPPAPLWLSHALLLLRVLLLLLQRWQQPRCGGCCHRWCCS
jgi:hypothetical protein